MEAPPSAMNKVVVVGSRSANDSPSPVTALQIPVQIPVQITHVCESSNLVSVNVVVRTDQFQCRFNAPFSLSTASSDGASGASDSETITLNSGALQTFELLPVSTSDFTLIIFRNFKIISCLEVICVISSLVISPAAHWHPWNVFPPNRNQSEPHTLSQSHGHTHSCSFAIFTGPDYITQPHRKSFVCSRVKVNYSYY